MAVEEKSNAGFLEALKASNRHLTTGQINPHLIECGGSNLVFLQALIQEELVSRDTACRIWGDSLGVAYVNPLVSVVTDEAVSRLPREIAEKARAIGLFVIQDVLTVAMATPEDQTLVKRLESIAGCPLSPVFALPKEIEHAVKLYYDDESDIQERLVDWEQMNLELINRLDDGAMQKMVHDSAIPKLLEGIIFSAIRQRASDIHLEPWEAEATVRFRIDGKLQEIYTCGRAVLRAFLIRCKVLSQLNISEFRLPQDGRFSLPFGMGQADFRYSEVPTHHGMKAVVRILSRGSAERGFRLGDLSMLPRVKQPFRRLLRSPNGILLVTGPTGSGKTTTLYAALAALNRPEVNIATIEDPIEIRLGGVNQSQTNSNIGLTFETLLRSFLRQDPDILLVGEIRDRETARIATQAALTGHFVLSTLHTNTAVQAMARLIDLGVEPYLVAPSLVGVLAQRLARAICEDCKEAYAADRDTLSHYFTNIPDDEPVWFYKGRGCSNCRNTGYSGRIGLHELVIVDEHMRGLIARNAPQKELTAHARHIGCQSLRYDALKKVLLGLTTMEEIDSMTVVEWETD